jgi:hypothetical protein
MEPRARFSSSLGATTWMLVARMTLAHFVVSPPTNFVKAAGEFAEW